MLFSKLTFCFNKGTPIHFMMIIRDIRTSVKSITKECGIRAKQLC